MSLREMLPELKEFYDPRKKNTHLSHVETKVLIDILDELVELDTDRQRLLAIEKAAQEYRQKMREDGSAYALGLLLDAALSTGKEVKE